MLKHISTLKKIYHMSKRHIICRRRWNFTKKWFTILGYAFGKEEKKLFSYLAAVTSDIRIIRSYNVCLKYF